MGKRQPKAPPLLWGAGTAKELESDLKLEFLGEEFIGWERAGTTAAASESMLGVVEMQDDLWTRDEFIGMSGLLQVSGGVVMGAKVDLRYG